MRHTEPQGLFRFIGDVERRKIERDLGEVLWEVHASIGDTIDALHDLEWTLAAILTGKKEYDDFEHPLMLE